MTTDLGQQIGQHHLCSAQELCNEKGKRKQILSEHPCLYRWWFPSNSPIMAFIREHFDNDYVEKELKQLWIDNTLYYALYFGKTTNGRKRFRQHIEEHHTEQSTLRETIRAIITETTNHDCCEKTISSYLSLCYYEWMEFLNDTELIDCFEIMAIAIGNYPLNIEGNHSVSKKWKDILMDKRHHLKKI